MPASHPANFTRSSAKIDIAAFDSLEKLQALIYPQQGHQRRSVAGTPAPISAQPSPAPAITPAHSGAQSGQTPQRSAATHPAQDITPQPASQGIPASLASPTKGDTQPSAAAKPDPQPPAPPAAFSASAAARSRPSSRAGPAEDKTGGLTTAEKLQYQASQKRISAGAFKAGGDKPGSSPHYPYASASPRAAKPYEPPAPGSEAEQALKQSTSGVLPPPSVASSGPIAPSAEKKEEDPLLAALAKLRNPSSAVDVLPPTSPGVPGGIGPGAVGLPGMARASQQQQPRSHSPYGQQPPSGQAPPRSHSPYASAANARSNPNMNSYSRPVSMTQSQSQPGAMYNQQVRSRPASPQPPVHAPPPPPHDIARAPSPSAAMMRPPSQPHALGPDAASTVSSYGQSFPGERRQSMAVPAAHPSQSRPASPSAAFMSPPGPQGAYAGVGSHNGRTSPAPGYAGQAHQQYQQGMRSPSPAPQPGYGPQQTQPQQQSSSYGQPPQQRPSSAYDPRRMSQPASAAPPGHGHSGSLSGPGMGQGTPLQQQQGRPTTPIGISLDASGSVTRDHMAERYQQQRQQTVSPRPQSSAGPLPPTSPYGSHPQAGLPPSQQSAGYRRGASIYQQAQSRQAMVASPSQPAMHPSQSMSPTYAQQPVTVGGQAAPPQGYGMYQQQPQRPPQSPYAAPPVAAAPQQPQSQYRPPSQNINRSQSIGYAPQSAASPQPQPMATSQSYRGTPAQYGQQHAPQQQQGYSPAPPVQQQPSYGYSQAPPPAQQYSQPPPAQQAASATQQPLQAPPTHHMPPTGQYTEAGQPILFYVKAIYKYDAASPEEFSFQKDDVIGVYGESVTPRV